MQHPVAIAVMAPRRSSSRIAGAGRGTGWQAAPNSDWARGRSSDRPHADSNLCPGRTCVTAQRRTQGSMRRAMSSCLTRSRREALPHSRESSALQPHKAIGRAAPTHRANPTPRRKTDLGPCFERPLKTRTHTTLEPPSRQGTQAGPTWLAVWQLAEAGDARAMAISPAGIDIWAEGRVQAMHAETARATQWPSSRPTGDDVRSSRPEMGHK